jgi:hypothetical protein
MCKFYKYVSFSTFAQQRISSIHASDAHIPACMYELTNKEILVHDFF